MSFRRRNTMQNEPSLTRKLVAELLGTGLLTLIGAGSVTATLTLEAGSKAPFSEADLGVISFAFAFIIVAMVSPIGKLSGCHINPPPPAPPPLPPPLAPAP